MNLDGGKVLLVGGAGLVGSHIVDQLLGTDVAEIRILDNFVRGTKANLESALEDPRVHILEGDIRSSTDVTNAVEGIDGVFLLAALWLLQCVDDPRSGLDVNIVGNLNVIEACRAAGVRRVVFSSSASVYGDAMVSPMPETHALNNRTFYGATKVAMEQALRAYNEMYGLDYIALRYFNVYGPRQDYRNAYVSVIMKVLDRLDAGLRPIIYNDGSQAYDFVYVGDIAAANVLAMRSDVSDVALNIATGVKTSIAELTGLLQQIHGSTLEPEYRETSQVFVTDRLGDPGLADRLIGFRAQVPLRTGLEELVAWRAARIRAESQR